MNISYKWLKEYVDFDYTPQELSDILTSLGLEIDSLEEHQTVKGGLEGYVIGQVLTCDQHPNADKLHKTTVNVGGERPLDIVCGAPNVAAGQKVVVATIGTKVCGMGEPFEIKKSKIRGEVSEGMLCAEDEMGIGKSHDGILVLPESAVVGTLAKTYFNIESDWIYEVSITPNRVDGASHIGVARDLVAYMKLHGKNVDIKRPDVSSFKVDNHDLNIPVEIRNTEACRRYSGVSITGIKIAESPAWLKNKMLTIGLNPINNVVDITNFVLHELGQPLHAFDADKIKGHKVIVQTLAEGTPFTTLDGIERKLSDKDLLICNEKEGMCLAGIFGGLDSGISDSTTSVFLESAYFNPVWVRKTARRHGLNTDSSFRFERGADPNITLFALKRAALLICELAGGKISSDIVDVYPQPIEDFKVELNFDRIGSLLGKKLENSTIRQIVEALEMKVVSETAESMNITVPPYRVDVQREADVAEDIARVYGYNNFEFGNRLNASICYSQKPDKHVIINTISDYLSSNGFNEMMANTLTKGAYYEQSESMKASTIYLKNPLSSDLNCLRQTLFFGGMEAILLNNNYRNLNLRLYEFGNCQFFRGADNERTDVNKYEQEQHLALFISGNREDRNWQMPDSPTSFFYLKAFVNNVLKRLGINPEQADVEASTLEFFSDGIQYKFNNKVLVEMGVVSKRYLKMFDLKQDVFYAEFYWDRVVKLAAKQKIAFKDLPKFPEVQRDLSLLIDESVNFAQIRQLAFKAEKKLLKSVSLFDVYQGDKIGEGKKSYAVNFTLRDENQTLDDKQIDKSMKNITDLIMKELGAQLR
jgi:phenylalanyl-tRNA synthetase beta chain